jgi:hypothetical protein
VLPDTVTTSPIDIKPTTNTRDLESVSIPNDIANVATQTGAVDLIITYVESEIRERDTFDRDISRDDVRPIGRDKERKVWRGRVDTPPEVM